MGLHDVLKMIDTIEDMTGKSGALLNTSMARRLFIAFATPDAETLPKESGAGAPTKGRTPTGKMDLDRWLTAEEAALQGLSTAGRRYSDKSGVRRYGYSSETDGAQWPKKENPEQ